jgi:RNA polymerase sigma factor (sigma-70 family)
MESSDRSDLSDKRLSAPEPASPPAVAPTTEAFWSLCEMLRPKLVAYLRALLPDHHAAEDCLQETWLILSSRYGKLPLEDLRPVAYACARNKALSWRTKQHGDRLAIFDPELLTKIAEAAANAASAEPGIRELRIETLSECLAALSPADRELIDTRYGNDRSANVIRLADQSGRGSDAVYKKLERLRALLKRCITTKLKSRA